MGNTCEWRKERRRAAVLRRSWRTSTFTTFSTCGSKPGVGSEPRASDRCEVCGRHRAGVPGEVGCRTVLGRTDGAISEVCARTASRQDAPSGIRTVRGRESEAARRREAGDVQLPWLHAHLREEEEQWNVHGGAANDAQAAAGQAGRGENRAPATPAPTHPGHGAMAAFGSEWALPLLRRAYEHPVAAHLPVSDRLALAPRAFAAQSERPHPLGPHAAADHPLAPSCSHLP